MAQHLYDITDTFYVPVAKAATSHRNKLEALTSKPCSGNKDMESLREAMVANEQDTEGPGARMSPLTRRLGLSKRRRNDYTLGCRHSTTNKALTGVLGMNNNTVGGFPLLFDALHVSGKRHRSLWLDLRMSLLFQLPGEIPLVPWVDLDMVGRSTPLPCHHKLFQISSGVA